MPFDDELVNLIRISDYCAELDVPYQGSAVDGMLLWLDEQRIKVWWNLMDAKIDPVPGGMFYLCWAGPFGDQVLYGVMEMVDTEECLFAISKLIYVDGSHKLGQFRLKVAFSEYGENKSSLNVRLSHNFDLASKQTFDDWIRQSWPGMFTMFRECVGR